eukprot:CAMPEP_0177542992 /NCGR_PEP_ID=MMETSP0369-20130122/61125_1 /TAXON_ID=447022 ORGANISM="Scrippsiella hangoei-like, Strain SHHI-4" /NCGR_SAMPLE_ID=MMETSP0369 /ASSEMBLY_ACC=CAM_ASM_000364 /LENGTH=223 /DNA_ID=CAMNT_0019026745 /DNA_START=35 /DNA_END=706 /DNA_ORIENTATION=-
MGSAFAKRTEAKTLMVGLDAAGKTSLLYALRLGEVVTIIPTIGFNVETLEGRTSSTLISFTVWDVGGRSSMRNLWRHYYKSVNSFIFVVDSNDRERMEDAKEWLNKMLSEDELFGVPLLVYANKQDLPRAMSITELTDKLGLHEVRNRAWFIQGSCATTSSGVYEGLDWLHSTLKGDALGVRDHVPPMLAKEAHVQKAWLEAGSETASTAHTEDVAPRIEVEA